MMTNPGSQKTSEGYTEKKENTIKTDNPKDIENSKNSLREDRRKKKSNLREG